jgi:uncharacterized protein (TIGR00255 family)
MGKGITRGKVDVWISIEVMDSGNVEITTDDGYIKGYLEALYTLRDKYGLRDDISVMTVARNTEIFQIKKPEEDIERDWVAFREALSEAVDAFIAGREREGANLERDIKQKVENIREKVGKIEALSAADVEGYRRKLEEKLRNMLSDNRIVFDENRILTECAIFADKVAIDEELVRLGSHFDGFYSIIAADEPVGRKLDFLVQEINREINTIGSKCSNAEIAALVVDMKCELEKIREQVQNLE